MGDNEDERKERFPKKGHVLSHRAYRDLRELEALREEYPKLLGQMIQDSAEKTNEIGDLQVQLETQEAAAREAEIRHERITAELQQRVANEQAIREQTQKSLGAEQGLGKDLQVKLTDAQERLTQILAPPESSNAGLAFFLGLLAGAIVAIVLLYFLGFLHWEL